MLAEFFDNSELAHIAVDCISIILKEEVDSRLLTDLHKIIANYILVEKISALITPLSSPAQTTTILSILISLSPTTSTHPVICTQTPHILLTLACSHSPSLPLLLKLLNSLPPHLEPASITIICSLFSSLDPSLLITPLYISSRLNPSVLHTISKPNVIKHIVPFIKQRNTSRIGELAMEMICEISTAGYPTVEFSGLLEDGGWQVQAINAIVGSRCTTGVAACLARVLDTTRNFPGMIEAVEKLVKDDRFSKDVLNTGIVDVLGRKMKHAQPLVRVVVAKVLIRLQKVHGPGFMERQKGLERIIRGHARMDKSLVVRELCRQMII
jgi:hypothetical protein